MRRAHGAMATWSVTLLLAATTAAHGEPPQLSAPQVEQIVEQGKGWYLVEIGDGGQSNESSLVWMVSAEGLGTVPLTESQRADLAAEFGGESLVDPGDAVPAWVALDKRAIDAMETGVLPQGYEDFGEPADFGGCGDRNKEKLLHFAGNRDAGSHTWNLGSGASGTLTAALPADLDANLWFRYKEKRTGIFGVCFTYGLSFRNVQVAGSGTFDGHDTLAADVTYHDSWEQSWRLIDSNIGHVSFWVGPIPVWIDFDFKLDVGAAVDVTATASVTLSTNIDAHGGFDYTCDAHGCTGSNSFQGGDFDLGDVNSGVEATIKPQVWAEPLVGAEVWHNPFLTILRGEAGLRGEVDADIWGYYGSTCGDADGDGHNETVRALTADAGWGYDIVYNYEILGSLHQHTTTGPRYHLGWWDLLDRLGLGQSTALQPMLLGPAVVPTHTPQSYTVRMRPCYPYPEQVNLALNGSWNGVPVIPEPRSTDPARNSTVMRRGFQQPGEHQVVVTNTVDGNGRAIDVAYTRAITAVDPAPPPPPLAPEIRVLVVGGPSVPDGGVYALPPTPIGELPLTATFEIWNDGDASLTLQNPGSLVSGNGFSQAGAVPAAIVAPGAHTSFQVRFQAASPWTYTGAIRILSNDADESPYDVVLSAAALGPCVADAATLCLRDGRFEVRVDASGVAAPARALHRPRGLLQLRQP